MKPYTSETLYKTTAKDSTFIFQTYLFDIMGLLGWICLYYITLCSYASLDTEIQDDLILYIQAYQSNSPHYSAVGLYIGSSWKGDLMIRSPVALTQVWEQALLIHSIPSVEVNESVWTVMAVHDCVCACFVICMPLLDVFFSSLWKIFVSYKCW